MSVSGFAFKGKFKATLFTQHEPYLRIELEPAIFPPELFTYGRRDRTIRLKQAEISFPGEKLSFKSFVIRATGYAKDGNECKECDGEGLKDDKACKKCKGTGLRK